MRQVCTFWAVHYELIPAPSFAFFSQQTIFLVGEPLHPGRFSVACRYKFRFAVAYESNTVAIGKSCKLLRAIQILNDNDVLVTRL